MERLPRQLPRVRAVFTASILLLCGAFAAQADDRDRDHGASARQLRSLIDQQVGGIDKLKVPATNAEIPVPPGKPAEPDRYITTEAKRFLGKMLFHDPGRTARININQGQPVDLPAGTAFGGTVNAANPNVQAIVNATRLSGGCGTCHFGEAATKAGQQINLHVGAEGRGYTDSKGNFIVRRRTLPILVQKRSEPLFPGDTLVDALPTLTDIDIIRGVRTVTTPAPFYHTSPPRPETLLATGRLDELDSVGRMSMSVIGFAFNNRLLFGGFAGEPSSTAASLNPFEDPAGENITLLLLDAHRMIGAQSAEIVKSRPLVKLFQDAFPKEAADAAAANDLTRLVNDVTVLRATATFLRTVVTRNTPFDKFVAGDDRALSASQRRGAALFFTKASDGGAGCVGCHSGPMLNKQANDPDVAGIGKFVEENFHNVGIGDHPVQALNALERGHIDRSKLGKDGFPYHAEDTGRQEITGNPDQAFKFRTLTLRQLKDGGNFFHNASLTKVRDVVEYFNAGVPQDPTAGAAATLSTRFTNPRGPGQLGLGLSAKQVDDLTDFLENALYDPAFRNYDPTSTTDAFQPHERDLTFSKYRPDLAALGAKDGFMLSGLAVDNNDPLSRRDMGVDPPIDVTSQAHVALIDRDRDDGRQKDVYRITNNSTSVIDTHLLMVAKGLPGQIQLVNGSGKTQAGDPYLRVFLKDGVIMPGQSIVVSLIFKGEHEDERKDSRLNYSLGLLSGQGQP